MKSILHGVAGAIALACIATFWTSTVVAELFLAPHDVAAVKNAVLTGMWLLIPAMAMTGASGFVNARGWRGGLIKVKARRMKVIAANGLLVLLPSAFVLAAWANDARFDAGFYALQVVELLAGAVNVTLLVRSMRDGMLLTGRVAAR